VDCAGMRLWFDVQLRASVVFLCFGSGSPGAWAGSTPPRPSRGRLAAPVAVLVWLGAAATLGWRGAEGEKAAGGARGEHIEVAPRGFGARWGSEHRGVAGGVEDQRAARLVRHVRNRTSLAGVASFPLSAPLHGADPRGMR